MCIRDRSRTSNFAEQVYRGMQSLCAKGAGSGERSARVKMCIRDRYYVQEKVNDRMEPMNIDGQMKNIRDAEFMQMCIRDSPETVSYQNESLFYTESNNNTGSLFNNTGGYRIWIIFYLSKSRYTSDNKK